ncbi:hypothetical protein HHK36_017902 [Tetracentron sinense]|uniref:Uncharacterized protein n=1 Tax=Tetracentron sinense TaxID=13715 RepID=A0A835DD07_TETSI|nr:hypothetical protein HHK36_017902 [Tetracentron sinense]
MERSFEATILRFSWRWSEEEQKIPVYGSTEYRLSTMNLWTDDNASMMEAFMASNFPPFSWPPSTSASTTTAVTDTTKTLIHSQAPAFFNPETLQQRLQTLIEGEEDKTNRKMNATSADQEQRKKWVVFSGFDDALVHQRRWTSRSGVLCFGSGVDRRRREAFDLILRADEAGAGVWIVDDGLYTSASGVVELGTTELIFQSSELMNKDQKEAMRNGLITMEDVEMAVTEGMHLNPFELAVAEGKRGMVSWGEGQSSWELGHSLLAKRAGQAMLRRALLVRQTYIQLRLETLKSPYLGANFKDLHGLKEITVTFENIIYNTATSQRDYVERISMKFMKLEDKSQSTGATNSLPSKSAGSNQNPLDPGKGLLLEYFGFRFKEKWGLKWRIGIQLSSIFKGTLNRYLQLGISPWSIHLKPPFSGSVGNDRGKVLSEWWWWPRILVFRDAFTCLNSEILGLSPLPTLLKRKREVEVERDGFSVYYKRKTMEDCQSSTGLLPLGYLAPEYAMRGHLIEKADVSGFGVVAMEILSGRPNSDSSLDAEKIYLLEWAWTLHENNCLLELVDPTLTIFDKNEAIRVIGVALLCTQASPSLRPPMSRVVVMLAGDIEVSSGTTRPGHLTDWQFNDITSGSVNDSISTSSASKDTNSLLADESTSPSMVVDPNPSPINITQLMLHKIIGEGR